MTDVLRDLAERTGESIDDVERWYAAGLFDDSSCSAAAVERVRLIGALERHGIDLETIAEAMRNHDDVVNEFTKRLTSDPPVLVSPNDELAASGLAEDVVERVVRAGNLEDALQSPTADDVAALQTIKTVVESGFPADALIQLIRVYSDAMDRIADAETRLFHLHVHQALRDSGLSGAELTATRDSISDQLEELIEPTLVYFHRKAWQRAMRYDFVIHMLEEIGVEVADSTHGQLMRAVLFVDLSSFTPLTSVMGDVTAADILERFSVAVRQVVRQHDGMVVKQIGDGFMLVFLDVISAARAADALNRRLSTEAQFPAIHGGIHYGPVLYREGDYVGTTVNVAARLLAEAGRHETVLTAAARRQAGELPNIAFHPIGSHHVKGVDEPLELYRLESAAPAVDNRQTDPVCGMQLRPNEVAARMTIGDEDYAFCSTRCMSIFVGRTPSGV
jgi:class 3 adenylate cyclase